jgi:hemoglobin-like flavoprotein
MTDAGPVRRPSAATIEAVRVSCLAVADRPVRLAEEFYAQLFDMAPHLRSMFPEDMSGQMRRMTDALLGAVAGIASADTDDLEVALRRLGAGHRTRHGVLPEHYGYIGHALTRAVREVAGPAYTGSLSSSWIAVYQWVASHMIAGAEESQRPPVAAAPPAVPVPRATAEVVPVVVLRPQELAPHEA